MRIFSEAEKRERLANAAAARRKFMPAKPSKAQVELALRKALGPASPELIELVQKAVQAK
jgi:hypothetical protein